MQKQICTVAVLSFMACSIAACNDSALDKPPGTYEKSTSATDANGTRYDKTTTTDVSVDAQGKKRAVVKSKTTKDPKGLFNKTTSSETDVEQSY